MSERAKAAHGSATEEAVGTVALFLNVIAFIAFSICLGSLAVNDILLAVAAGFVSVAAFVVSLACFVAESGRTANQADSVLPIGPVPMG